MKRTIIILVIILLVAGISYAGYLYRHKTSGAPTATGTSANTNGSLPGGSGSISIPVNTSGSSTSVLPASANFGVAYDQPTADYFLDKNNNLLVVQADGQVARIIGGQATIVASSSGLFLDSKFSYDGSFVMLQTGTRAASRYSVFSFASSTWTSLPSGITSFSWSPTQNKLAIQLISGGANQIETADFSKKGVPISPVLSINLQDVRLVWAASDAIMAIQPPSAAAQGSVWKISPQNKTVETIVSQKPGADSVWSPDGKYGLVFYADASTRGGTLALVNFTGGTISTIQFLTLPDKCTFTATAFICAVPQDAQSLQRAMLPDDYYQKALFTQDSIYLIDISTGNVSQLLDGSKISVDASNLKMLGNKLFFVNRYDQKLYAVAL